MQLTVKSWMNYLPNSVLLGMFHFQLATKEGFCKKKMDKHATLLIDGWTNSSSNQQNVVAMLTTANDEKIFLESFDISESRETSEKLVEIVKECADLAKEKYDTEIYAIVTDNAANMTCMGSQIKPDV